MATVVHRCGLKACQSEGTHFCYEHECVLCKTCGLKFHSKCSTEPVPTLTDPNVVIETINFMKTLLDFMCMKLNSEEGEMLQKTLGEPNLEEVNKILSQFRALKQRAQDYSAKNELFKLILLERDATNLLRRLKKSQAYFRICEMVTLSIIFSETPPMATSQSSSDSGDQMDKDALISKLKQKLGHYEASDLQRQEYTHHVTKITEKLKAENYELTCKIEKLVTASEREINAREIENNELRKRLENVMQSQKKSDYKSHKNKTVVVNYTELKNETIVDEKDIEQLTHESLQKSLRAIFAPQKITVDSNFIFEIKCDDPLGKKILSMLIQKSGDKVTKICKLPPMKRMRIDNIVSTLGDVLILLKHCMPEELQIFNFNVNGTLLDIGLFIDRLCDNVVSKVNNLYLYYLKYKESDIIKLCSAIHKNDHFQDLRIYASKLDISLFAKHLKEDTSIWLLSVSFNKLKAEDADSIIEILKKLKRIKEFCAHHNNLGEEGCVKITQYIADNLIDQIDYLDLSNNQVPTEKYAKILQKKGYKGVVK